MDDPDAWELRVSESVLISFDGRVLEVFGFIDVYRIHLAFQPRMEIVEGKRLRLRIVPTAGGTLRCGLDPDRVDEARDCARRLAAALERSGHAPVSTTEPHGGLPAGRTSAIH